MKILKKYVGINFKKSTFVTFGNHDMRILNQSIAYNIHYPKEITSQIQKNYFDFAAYISEFIRDDKGNPLSLVHYCELFGLEEAGKAHDPEVDAINLANLYDEVLVKSNLVVDEYKKHLRMHSSHLPEPIANAVTRLASGENVTAEEFEESLKKYLS
jgi:inhibitor of KinA sporulation pathway (predicted exonuclease)